MNRLIVLVFALIASLNVLASPVSLNFSAVPLVAFAEATYKSMLGVDYVIAPEVVTLEKKVTVNVKSIDSAKLAEFVANILLQQGVQVTPREGVYYLELAQILTPEQADQGKAVVPASPTPRSFDFDHVGARVVQRVGEDGLPIVKKEEPTESTMFVPQNRPSDFIVDAINAGFGAKSSQVVGSRVMLTGTRDRLQKMMHLIADLDYLPKSVEVSASWVEVTHTTGAGLGISVAANVLGQKFAANLGTTSSGSALSLTGTNFQLVIDALNTDSRFKQVSNSRMVGDESQKISLIVGDETPTISSTSTNSAGNPVQNIVYRPSGIIIDVFPKVLGSGKINVALDGQISSFQATTNGVAGSPTLIKRQLKTDLTVADGEVLLIGGLNDTQSTKASTGWAFLPDSWSSKNDSGVQTDLVLVLSAKVTNQGVKQ